MTRPHKSWGEVIVYATVHNLSIEDALLAYFEPTRPNANPDDVADFEACTAQWQDDEFAMGIEIAYEQLGELVQRALERESEE